MKLVKRILLATDFAKGSDDAAATAIHLASRLGGEVVLMHVLPKQGVFAPIVDELKQQAEERLAALKERFEAEQVTRVSTRIVSGDAYEEIVYHAEVMDVSLVVVGGSRFDDRERPRLGTTAERVIRHCRKPVWVVRPGSRAELRRILCPVDMSEHSARALRSAIQLASRLETPLDVLHVVRPLSSFVPHGRDLVDRSLDDEYFDERAGAFEEFLRGFDFDEVRWTSLLERGEPAPRIAALARQERTDLVIMGSVGRTGLSRFLMGSVATKVAREIPCSVLTVKDVDAFHTELQPEIDDIWKRYEQGQRELREGRAQEAVEQFEICISRSRLFVRAWDGLADAYETLGVTEAATRSRETATRVYMEIWERRVENEVRAKKTNKSRLRDPSNSSAA